MDEPKQYQRTVYIAIAISTTLLLMGIGYVLHLGNHMIVNHGPHIDAIMEVELEVTVAHLWLEEMLSGDRIDNMQSVYQHLAAAEGNATAVIIGGENRYGVCEPVEDGNIKASMNEVLAYIRQLRMAAEKRWVAKGNGKTGAGSAEDIAYDRLYAEFMDKANMAENQLRVLILGEMAIFKNVQIGLLIYCVFLSATAGLACRSTIIGLYRSKENILRANVNLASTNEQLDLSERQLSAANEQLTIKESELTARNQRLRETEEELLEANERQRAILEAVPDIIMEVDIDKVYTWGNNAGYEFFGEDVVGKEASHYFEGEQGTYDVLAPVFEGDENKTYVESWQRRKDGETRLMAWWCRVLKRADGSVSGALSTARDVTDNRAAEMALMESERTLRALYSAMEEGVSLHELVYDEDDKPIDYRLLNINEAYERITGLKRHMVIGKCGSEIYGTGQPPYMEEFSGVAVSGDPIKFETYFPPMKKYFSISVTCPVRGQFACVFVDTTSQHDEAEAEG